MSMFDRRNIWGGGVGERTAADQAIGCPSQNTDVGSSVGEQHSPPSGTKKGGKLNKN